MPELGLDEWRPDTHTHTHTHTRFAVDTMVGAGIGDHCRLKVHPRFSSRQVAYLPRGEALRDSHHLAAQVNGGEGQLSASQLSFSCGSLVSWCSVWIDRSVVLWACGRETRSENGDLVVVSLCGVSCCFVFVRVWCVSPRRPRGTRAITEARGESSLDTSKYGFQVTHFIVWHCVCAGCVFPFEAYVEHICLT